MTKKLLRLALVIVAVITLFASCGKVLDVEEEQIYGRWSASDGYTYVFNEDHTGSSTDDSGRGLNFTWELSLDELELRYTGSGSSSKVGYETYVITSISDYRMEAYDRNDPDETTITFTKY